MCGASYRVTLPVSAHTRVCVCVHMCAVLPNVSLLAVFLSYRVVIS